MTYKFGRLSHVQHASFFLSKGWLGSFALSLVGLLTPLTVFLEQKFRKRLIALAGVLIFCAGLLMTSFVPALGYAYVTFGVFTGFGANFIMHSTMSLLLDWFTKEFSRSSAIALLGTAGGIYFMYLILFYVGKIVVRKVCRA